MVQVNKIDSNVTSTRYQEETSIGVANPANDWVLLEPNTFSDFGGEITTVARNPINPDRQRKKGVTTDLDASGGFNNDLTQANLEDILQGFFFADLERKTEYGVLATEDFSQVDGTAEEYERAAGDFSADGWLVGALAFASTFVDPANNGIRRVVTVAALALGVAEDLVDETPAAGVGALAEVGFQFAAGDADIDAAGTRPALTTTTKDLTELGLIPGEHIFLGGDLTAEQFVNAGNNGFVRVRSITANRMEFDKTAGTMVTEDTTTETIRLFFGRRLRNRTGTDIKRRTYQLERQLGAPDDALPTQIQAEYLVGSVANELTLNVPTADKVTVDLGFIAIDSEQIDGPTALKAGPRPALTEADAFNTSSDVSRIKLAEHVEGTPNPTPLFAFVQELTLTISNNASPNKAVGTLGGFDVTVGNFNVGGSLTAYFSNVDAITAVRQNKDITLDLQFVKVNAGISIDLPLLTLGEGRPDVAQDAPILIPLSNEAATGSKLDSALNHTLMFIFFDFLPTLADT